MFILTAFFYRRISFIKEVDMAEKITKPYLIPLDPVDR